MSRGTPSSSAATAISPTYRLACGAGSNVPNSLMAASAESTNAACTHNSSAGSEAAYGMPVMVSVPRTCSWIARTRCAACLAPSLSP